jgi:hypothetical protein
MRASIKLALFSVLLVVVFVVSAGVGALVDSGETSSTPAHVGHSR